MDINIENILVKIEIGSLTSNPARDYLYSPIFFSSKKKYKMVKQTYFQDVWLTDVGYKSWVAKTKNKKTARCLICKADISLSSMGSALDEHARGHKHQKRDQSRNQSSLSSIFQKHQVLIVDLLIVPVNSLNAE